MDEVRNQRFLAKLENVKNQPETNNTIIEMKNTLFFHWNEKIEGIKSK